MFDFRKIAWLLISAGVGSSVSADELKIVSWNMANLASGPGVGLRGYNRPASDYANLRAKFQELAPDVVALQEVGSIPGAKAVLGDGFDIYFETRCMNNPQHCDADNDDIYTAIAFRNELADTLQVFQIDELSIDHSDECGTTRPVRGGVGVKASIGGQTVWIPSVHMKASCKDDRIEPGTEDDCKTQKKQYEILAKWIADRPDGDAVIVAGDMNRELLENKDSIRNEVIQPQVKAVEFLPSKDQRLCWQSYHFDFAKLSKEARKNNPVFDAENIRPWIYTPRSNQAIDFFVAANVGAQLKLASKQIDMTGLYRFENPSETLKQCDGSVLVNDKREALTFGEAYPSDHCPISLTVSD